MECIDVVSYKYVMLTNLRTPAFSCSSRMVDASDIFSFFLNKTSVFSFPHLSVLCLLKLRVTDHKQKKSLFSEHYTIESLQLHKRTCHELDVFHFTIFL